MLLISRRSYLTGLVRIPASKSHTIRAIAIGSLASGQSRIANPLSSSDTASAIEAYKLFGAKIDEKNVLTINGVSGILAIPDNVVDVGN